jgi:hypothetical protein
MRWLHRFGGAARAWLLLLALSCAGCAGLPPRPPLAAQDQECSRWLESLDAAVEFAGVRDAEAERIEGFPGLRVNRLHAALAARAAAAPAAFDAWLDALRRLDLDARRIELANLPQGSGGDRASALARLEACSAQLAAALRHDAASQAALLARAQVPDRYSVAARAAGLYPLARLPFFAGVQRWEREHAAAMRQAMQEPRPARRLVPALTDAPAPAHAAMPVDALGLPRPDAQAAERLLAAHAPVFDIEHAGPFDDVGTPAWQADGRIGVDAAAPVVYQRLTHTLVQGRPLRQLVYTLWFPERPRRGTFDLLGGTLDGVIVRLTLGADGRPLMVDTIHACGCYHLFFPASGVSLKPGAPTGEEWAFVPAPLPTLAPGQRIVVRIESTTHYVLGVTAAVPTATGMLRYARRPESDLQRLPLPNGGTRSLYGPDGLVAGSERAERFFFWPMGIASAGAMRQWGHHATAFVGRRHFDDADLLERRFSFPQRNDEGPAMPALFTD